MKTPYRSARRQQGVALLEALIAIVLLGIGLLGAVGLQARSYAAISEAGLRAEATLAAEELMGIINNDKARLSMGGYQVAANAPTPPELAQWAAELDKRIPGAKYTIAVGAYGYTPLGQSAPVANYRVDITIRWTRRKDGVENRHQVTSYVI